MGSGLVTGFTKVLELATTNNYNIITNLYTLQLTAEHANPMTGGITVLPYSWGK
jgi:hypothetical protein